MKLMDISGRRCKILLGPGNATPRMTAEADVVIGGEQQEADGGFDNVEYVADAASLGMPKGLIMLGHVISVIGGQATNSVAMRLLLRPFRPIDVFATQFASEHTLHHDWPSMAYRN